MSQRTNLESKRSNSKHNSQTQVSIILDESLSFDDLIIDGSLLPVNIKINLHRNGKTSIFPDEDSLPGLQCEV